MQQVQDLLKFKIETPENEELRRRFEGEERRLKSFSEENAADPTDYQQTMDRLRSLDLSNVHRQRNNAKNKRRAARKARKVARRRARA